MNIERKPGVKRTSAGEGGIPLLSSSIRRSQREGLFPVISEIKVRSEKEGDLLGGRDPVALARKMASCPVAGISVVTEPEHFGGNMDLLRTVAASIDLPVLHKDFIVSTRQIEESADAGASAILLISEILGTEQMRVLIEEAKNRGLETLVEAHSAEELNKILHLPFDLMGINNRDITIYEVDDSNVSRTEALAVHCSDGRLLVSESSIASAEEVRRAGKSGADAVLVGTAVLKAPSIQEFLKELTSVGWPV
ncbi:MAG: indole-3-glycerol-phosphate synthase [Syntrophales bacterium]|jgi:indole-3-glycerol phosphate synthase|nr:indole-3-glycerol-phosphate synthase [Syntrophales bacterium]